MMEVLQKGPGYEHKVIESTHNLLACLLSDSVSAETRRFPRMRMAEAEAAVYWRED